MLSVSNDIMTSFKIRSDRNFKFEGIYEIFIL